MNLDGPIVNSKEEAWKIQNTYEGLAHGWIQWKGTEICMDIHCKCGELTHVDASFCYYVSCSFCGRMYMCNGHIQLIEVKNLTDDIEVVIAK